MVKTYNEIISELLGEKDQAARQQMRLGAFPVSPLEMEILKKHFKKTGFNFEGRLLGVDVYIPEFMREKL